MNIEILKQFINDGGSATFGSVLAQVEQKMFKTGNPLKNCEVTKLVTYNVSLNCNYQNSVNNALGREGKEQNFVSKENWHKTVYDSFNGSIVAKKSDESCTYLKMIVNSATTHQYFVNGILATDEQIETIKQFKQKSSAANQNLDNEIVVRTIKIQNILKVKAGGDILTA